MSDRYLVNDCNIHYSCCHNSYKVTRDQQASGEQQPLTVAEVRAEQTQGGNWLRQLVRRGATATR